jgi:outer membrane cobalamin receptor
VTNLVTRPVDPKTGGEAGISAAGPGTVRGRVRAQHQFGIGQSVWLSLSGAKGSGTDFYFPEFAQQQNQGHSVGADGFQTRTLQGRVTWKALTLQAFFNTHEKRLSTGEFDSLLGDPRSRQADTRGFVEARAEPVLATGVQLLHRTYWNLYRFRGSYARDTANAGVEYDTFDGQWAGIENRLVLSQLKNWRIETGFEYQLHYRIDQRGWDDIGFFLGDSARTPHRHVIGAVYGLVSYKYSDALSVLAATRNDHHSQFGWSTNPRVAIILKPYRNGNAKLLWGAAFRAPSVYERYYNDSGFTQVGGANLSPERLYSLELEHTHRFSSTVSTIGAVYGNYIRDPIIVRGTGNSNEPLQYRNSASPLLSLGAELLVRREWDRGFMVEATASLQRTRYIASESISDLVSNAKDPSSRRVANSPTYLAALKAVMPLIVNQLSVATRVTLEGPRADRYELRGEQAQQASDAVLLWDVVLSGSARVWPLKYSLGVYNLADYRYSLPVSAEFSQRTIRQNGRTFLASLDVTF